MNRLVVKSTVSSDGILHLAVPVGMEEANKEVQVTVEPVLSAAPLSQQEWRKTSLSTGGKWQGRSSDLLSGSNSAAGRS